jgi:hypothetical protein
LATPANLRPTSWVCGYCSITVAESQGWRATGRHDVVYGSIMICPRCRRPNFFEQDEGQSRESLPGESIPHVPEPVNGMYECMKRHEPASERVLIALLH